MNPVTIPPSCSWLQQGSVLYLFKLGFTPQADEFSTECGHEKQVPNLQLLKSAVIKAGGHKLDSLK